LLFDPFNWGNFMMHLSHFRQFFDLALFSVSPQVLESLNRENKWSEECLVLCNTPSSQKEESKEPEHTFVLVRDLESETQCSIYAQKNKLT
jgi:hypothetical protein